MPPFEYRPFVNPYTASIGELLLHQGDIAAHAAEAKGQAYAQAFKSVGDTIGAIPQQQAQAKVQGQETQLRGLQIDQAKQSAADLKSLDTAFSQPGGRDAIIEALPGHLRPTVQKQFDDQDKLHADAMKSQQEADALKTEAFANTAAGVAAHGNDPSAAQLAISDLKQKYANDPATLQTLQRYEAQLQANPTTDTVKQMTDALMAASPKRVELQQKAEDLQREMATSAESARHNKETERIAALTEGKAEAAQQETARHNLEIERLRGQQVAQGDQAPTLTPEAIKLTAHQFAMTGQLPPMGMGKQGAKLRTDIINAAADEYKNLDLPSQQAAYKANQQSLVKLQGQRDAVGAFESTALKNIDLFLSTAGKVVDTGSPLMNTPLRMASGQLLGSPDQAAYDAARQVAVNEIAKITSNPNLSGTLSDSARQEISAFNPASATLAQSVKVMRTLKQDMENRRSSLDDQIKAVQARIATPPGATPASTPASTPATPADGTRGSVNGVPAVWKTVNGRAGWYKQ